MDSTSASLLERLRQPDQEAAWRRFVDLYGPLIYWWGRSQGLSAADASDLLQEVLIVLVNKLPDFEYDPRQRFRGWLRTITVNKARDIHRRRSARPAPTDKDLIEQVATVDAADLFEESEYRSFLVNRALDLMQSEFREVTWRAFWMQTVEGTKAADVAEKLGVPINVVYLAKSRVLGRLREELAGLME